MAGRKKIRNATRERVQGPRTETVPKSSRLRPRLRLVVLVLVAAAAGTSVVFVLAISRTNAFARRLPAIPDLSGKTESLKQAIAVADRRARQAHARAEDVGQLGRLYQANHFAAQADACYCLATESEPRNSLWCYLLAVTRETTSTGDEVLELLRKTVSLAPTYTPAHLRLADLLLKRNELDAAGQEYRTCLRQSPSSAHAQLGLARIAVARTAWPEAESLLRRTLEADPAFGSAHRLLATVYENLGSRERADASKARAEECSRFRAAADPWVDSLDDVCFDPAYLLVRADMAKQTRDPQRSLALMRRAVEVAPSDPRPHETLGTALRELGDLAGARPLLRRAIELGPKDADALVAFGLMLGTDGKLDEAERTFQAAFQIDSLSTTATTALNGIGNVRVRQGDDVAAASFFLKACELSDFRFDDAIENYVGCMVRLKRQPEAIELLKRIVPTRPTAVRVRTLLARVYKNLGEQVQAIATLRDAMAVSPYNALLANALAEGLATSAAATPESGREAVQWAQRAVDLAMPEKRGEYLGTLAAAYARAGDFGQATATAEQALRMAKDSGDMRKQQLLKEYLQRFKAGEPISSQ
jgi:HemY protein